jgi:hypothetical protein
MAAAVPLHMMTWVSFGFGCGREESDKLIEWRTATVERDAEDAVQTATMVWQRRRCDTNIGWGVRLQAQ